MRGLSALPIFARVGILGGLIAFTLISLAATLWYSDTATTRALADQTAKATLEIADQIDAIQKSGDHAIAAIGSMASTIDRVSASTTAIASAIEQQDAAAREIAGSVSQAAAGTSQVTESITALSVNVRDTDAGAGEMLSAAQGVSGDAERLKDALASFLQQIRAA
jgi:methyl-accepting chemotaxis protein